MKETTKCIPSIDLKTEFKKQNKSPKGKIAFNCKKARKETKNKQKYSSEVNELYNLIKNKFDTTEFNKQNEDSLLTNKKDLLSVLETKSNSPLANLKNALNKEESTTIKFYKQHKESLLTSINYLLCILEKKSNSPLAKLKNALNKEEFATFIAYLFGGIGDQDSEIDKFMKKLQRNYINNINLAKYQYCFRYYFFGEDLTKYHNCNSLSEYIDYLYEFVAKDKGKIDTIESSIYYYYSMGTRATAFQEKTHIFFSEYYFNNFEDLRPNYSLLVLFMHMWDKFQLKPLEEFSKYADSLLNILHNSMQEYTNQLDIYLDSNLSVFENINNLNSFISMMKNNINVLYTLINKVDCFNPSSDNLFSTIAIFEHFLVNTHLSNIEIKAKCLCGQKSNSTKIDFKQLQFISVQDFQDKYCKSDEDFIHFCANKNNITKKTFNKNIDLLKELDDKLKLNSSYFGNLSTPQIKVRVNLNNILHLRIIYNEFFNNGSDSYIFFGKDNGVIKKHLIEMITLYGNIFNQDALSNNIEYKIDNSNFKEAIVDEYKNEDMNAFTLSVLLSEKLRRGFYAEANMESNYNKIISLKKQVLDLFTKISSIYDTKTQYMLFFTFYTNFLRITKSFEQLNGLKNRKIIPNKNTQ